MSKLLEIALGIVTSIGGFLEVGSMATAAQAGAAFGYQHIWAIALGAICLAVLLEMSGRLAAVSQHTIAGAVRDRFGLPFFTATVVPVLLVTLLVLASEIGGVCLALQLATGIAVPWFAAPVALLVWLVLWKGSFGFIEQGVSVLGLVTVVFVVGVLRMQPEWTKLGASLLPSLPSHDAGRYWFIAVAILGASLTPYLFYFYSSGAIEDRWDTGHLAINRIVATVGMGFGGLLSIAVLVVAALVLEPRGIQVDRYEQVALVLVPSLGRWGFWLFVASLGIACLGAALEIALSVAYLVAQGLGWNWGKNLRPREAARFTVVYSLVVAVAAVPIVLGIDPLKLTVLSMVLTSASLPLAVVPFLVLMNDRHYVHDRGNGWLANLVVALIVVLASVVALVSLPLQLMAG